MRVAAGVLIAVILATLGCEICTSNGDRRCNGANLEVCNDGDWIRQQCVDAGVTTTCRQASDGGAEC